MGDKLDAAQVSSESGIPVGPQQQGPMASPPVDPAAAAAAAGQQGAAPADPAAASADPMAGAAPADQQSVEDMAASGDPLATYLVTLSQKIDLLIQIQMAVADKMQLQQPASQAFQSQLKQIEKTGGVQAVDRPVLDGVLDDDPDDDFDMPKQASQPEAVTALQANSGSSLGNVVSNRVSQGNRFLDKKELQIGSVAGKMQSSRRHRP